MGALQLTDLNGFYKEIYGDKLVNSIPDNAKLLKRVPFEKRKQLGEKYTFPEQISSEQGLTFNTDGSAFALNDAVPFGTQNAELSGSEMVLRSQISYKAVKAGMNDKASFGNTLAKLTQNLTESHARAAEIAMWYGGVGLGRATAHTTNSATSETLTISAASWASGIWAGSKNMKVNFYAADDSTLISSGADAVFTITAVSFTDRKITVSGTATGCTALAAAVYTVGLYIYKNGAKGKEMYGVDKILTNTGTLFNIDAATYDQWLANTPTTTGDLSFSKIIEAVVPPSGRGLQDKKVTAFLSPFQFTKLASDAASLRKLDSSYKKGKYENGFDGATPGALTFYGVTGEITIEPHSIVKNGDVFILPLDTFVRVGAQDIEIDKPNGGSDVFSTIAGYAGYEMRTYSDFGILTETPSWCTKLTGFNAS